MPPGYPRLQLTALRGDAREGPGLIDAAIAGATARGEGMLVGYGHFAKAMLLNGLGEYEAARDAAARTPFAFAGLVQRELIEAAVRTDEPGVAQGALSELREYTRSAGTDWALGIEASCAALLAGGAEANALHREALDRLERSGCETDHCRAQLLYGEWLRREGRRLEARAQLRSAYEALAAMGAGAFAERALREVRATGEHVRRRSPETVDELTPQELQIARLVGAGATSKEVAEQLFVSKRTVDAHLRNIFRKLGITSRRQLRGMPLDEPATTS